MGVFPLWMERMNFLVFVRLTYTFTYLHLANAFAYHCK